MLDSGFMSLTVLLTLLVENGLGFRVSLPERNKVTKNNLPMNKDILNHVYSKREIRVYGFLKKKSEYLDETSAKNNSDP